MTLFASEGFHLIDGGLRFDLRLGLAGLRQSELGIRLSAHQDELRAAVVTVMHQLLRLLHFFLCELHRERGWRNAVGSDLLCAANPRFGRCDALGRRRVTTATCHEYRAQYET